MPDSAISRKSFSGELAGVLRRSERRHAGVVGHHVTRVVCEPPWGGVFPRTQSWTKTARSMAGLKRCDTAFWSREDALVYCDLFRLKTSVGYSMFSRRSPPPTAMRARVAAAMLRSSSFARLKKLQRVSGLFERVGSGGRERCFHSGDLWSEEMR